LQSRILRRPREGFLAGAIGITSRDLKPERGDRKKSGVALEVRNDLRINSLLFLRWPDGKEGLARFLEIEAEEDSTEIRLSALFRGERGLSEPQGFFLIRSLGRRIPFGEGQVIVEGSLRQLPGESIEIPSGEYRVEAWSGGRRLGSRVLRVGEDGALPDPRAKLSLRLDKQEVLPGEKVQVRASVENSSRVPFLLRGRLGLYPLGSSQAVVSKKIPSEALDRGERASEKWSFLAPEKEGVYEVVLSTRLPLEQRVTSFLVRKKAIAASISRWQALRDWISGNPLAGMALGSLAAALLLAAVFLVVFLFGRLRKRLSLGNCNRQQEK
jgi:hypothetical protein